MKKKEAKAIKHKLIDAVEKVLTDNNTDLITKIEKDLNKSIKQVAKISNKKGHAVI